MIYDNIFIKFKSGISLEKALLIFEELQSKHVTPIKYKIVQTINCTEIDVENVLKSGQISSVCHGYISCSQNGIWGCIALCTDSLTMLLYTAGHQIPLYYSIICNQIKIPLQ